MSHDNDTGKAKEEDNASDGGVQSITKPKKKTEYNVRVTVKAVFFFWREMVFQMLRPQKRFFFLAILYLYSGSFWCLTFLCP